MTLLRAADPPPDRAAAPPAVLAGPIRRILLLYADVGEGHLSMARALASELAEHAPEAEIIQRNGLASLGWLPPRLIRDGYRMQLGRCAWIYGSLYRAGARSPLLRKAARAGLFASSARPLMKLIRAHDPDLVISTHPAANPVLGQLRLTGRLGVPAWTAIIDHADIPFWAHRGLDLHLVMFEESVAPVAALAGAERVRRVRPLIDPTFFRPCPAADARRALGLDGDGPLVLVSGGGWGVGDLAGAVRAALELPGAQVVCLAGRSPRVRERLEAAHGSDPRVTVLAFSDRMSELLAACDAAVLSSGGMTCLEALVRECPVVAYSAPPGHAATNFRTLAGLGLLRVAESPAEITEALRAALSARPVWRLADAPGAGELLRRAREGSAEDGASRQREMAAAR